jgi:hypothetical protein
LKELEEDNTNVDDEFMLVPVGSDSTFDDFNEMVRRMSP